MSVPNADVAAFGRKPHSYWRRSAETPLRQKSRITDTITDGAYDAMMQAIRNDEAPSYFFLHYEIMKPPSPPRSGGEGRGEVARIKTPRPAPLPAGRGEGMLWLVRNLLLVPSFAFPPSATEIQPFNRMCSHQEAQRTQKCASIL